MQDVEVDQIIDDDDEDNDVVTIGSPIDVVISPTSKFQQKSAKFLRAFTPMR